MLPGLLMASANPFQTVAAAEDQRRAAVPGTDRKSISANLSPRRGIRMASMCKISENIRAKPSLTYR